jgi:hypothetical protein
VLSVLGSEPNDRRLYRLLVDVTSPVAESGQGLGATT